LLTSFVLADLYFARNTEYGFFEIQIDIFTQIGTTLCARTASSSASAEEIAEPKQVAEDVAEILEDDRVEIDSATTA